jgi:hypothetical protein
MSGERYRLTWASSFYCCFCFLAVRSCGVVILWYYNCLCNQFLSPKMLWVWISLWRGVLYTIFCDKVCQWLVAGRCFFRVLWFPPPIKLTPRYNWNIVESCVKHHNWQRTNSNLYNTTEKTNDWGTWKSTKYNKYVVNKKKSSILMIYVAENLLEESEGFI